MDPSLDRNLSKEELDKLLRLKQEAAQRFMDVDFETLTIVPLGDPAWNSDPEEDRKSYKEGEY